MNRSVADSFEKSFLSRSLSEEIARCDRYELAGLFLETFRDRQPVLEAGCGSGRWCGWLDAHGIRTDGVDWSRELCERAQQALPSCRFIAGDMARMPVPDGAYGGLLALGSIEHTLTGPQACLREFLRVVRPGGLAIITVPYGGPLRRAMRFLSRPLLRCRASPWLRRLAGKETAGKSLAEARREARAAWHPRFGRNEKGWHFYEYEFSREQMRGFLAEAGWRVAREFVAFRNEGILNTFGRPAGRWNPERQDVDFTPLGRVLRALLPAPACGHMLGYVAEKPAAT